MSARTIALTLDCPIETVLGCLSEMGVADAPQEEFGPYETMNS